MAGTAHVSDNVPTKPLLVEAVTVDAPDAPKLEMVTEAGEELSSNEGKTEVRITAADMLGAYSESPEYLAVMLYVPTSEKNSLGAMTVPKSTASGSPSALPFEVS